jgi:hypothetical protein
MRNVQNLKRMAAVMVALAMVVLTVTECSKSAANESETEKPKTEAVDNGLAAPAGIEAVATATAADGTVAVTWSAVDGALKYDVYGAGVHAITTDTSYTLDGLAPGEYNVRVIALGGPRSSEASKVTFVVTDGGAVETTAVDVPELKVESKSTSKSDSKTDSKKTDSTTTTDKAKASTGNSNSSSENKNTNTGKGGKDTGNTDSGKSDGNGNSSTSNSNNANTGNSGSGTNTGGGNTTTTPITPTPDPHAGKTYVPEQRIWQEPTYKTVHYKEEVYAGTEDGIRCNTCDFTLWGYGRSSEMNTHLKENHHAGYHTVSRAIWDWKEWDEQVVDVAGQWKVIPEHWE